MQLSPTMEKYIVHWGEMGTKWGVNRSVAQIHALLFLVNQPLTAEEISDTLNLVRSNVSNSLKELQSWGLIKKVQLLLGDRRDYYIALQDVWEIFRVITEERKKRELDPTLTVLRQCAIEAETDTQIEAATRVKMDQVLEFLEVLLHGYDDFKNLPPSVLLKLLKMGGKIGQLAAMFGKDEEK
ncbi:MarR family transcriptional regulator [Iodobacter sp. LRB]|uniref:HTH-type transcriptional regulator n=1 Tax=Iodobacter violaceini TaxID=3044271 RepID=A0ABX0KQZ6_9NEIS|nr:MULTISPECIES: MarR family transcriptional regulator [Iodobacter]NHQ84705.1 MarR family transcriptional regulator [Iodobacter violacea]PHV02168.1 ArsR family transcriptional regulator [Iodobacter sp. BJB302]